MESGLDYATTSPASEKGPATHQGSRVLCRPAWAAGGGGGPCVEKPSEPGTESSRPDGKARCRSDGSGAHFIFCPQRCVIVPYAEGPGGSPGVPQPSARDCQLKEPHAEEDNPSAVVRRWEDPAACRWGPRLSSCSLAPASSHHTAACFSISFLR